ncbi:hypothetical protein MMC18_004349 [Xylographa bjoerkii]|nr:hypothetical protein [Xylographa bjoerkii]
MLGNRFTILAAAMLFFGCYQDVFSNPLAMPGKNGRGKPLALAYSGTGRNDPSISPDQMGYKVTDAYHDMQKQHAQTNQDENKFPASMAGISIPGQGQQFASSVRGGTAGTTGPLKDVHPALQAAIPAGCTHRTDLKCAEMHATNDILYRTSGQVPPDTHIKTFGTPNSEDGGAAGGKKFMDPCLDEAGTRKVGCRTVLDRLNIKHNGPPLPAAGGAAGPSRVQESGAKKEPARAAKPAVGKPAAAKSAAAKQPPQQRKGKDPAKNHFGALSDGDQMP